MPNNIEGNRPGVPPVQNTAHPRADAASTAQGAAEGVANTANPGATQNTTPTASRNHLRQASLMRAGRDHCLAQWRAWARVGGFATARLGRA